MTKYKKALGLCVIFRSLAAAQSNYISQGTISFKTLSSPSSNLMSPPFLINNATSSSASPPWAGSGASWIPPETTTHPTTIASISTGSTAMFPGSIQTSSAASVSSLKSNTNSVFSQSITTSSGQTVSKNSDGMSSTSVTASRLNTIITGSTSANSILVPGDGILPFPTTTSRDSSSVDIPMATTFAGSWSESANLSPVSFTSFNIPTMTISDAPEETSESKLLGGLFLALRANRNWLEDSNLKVQYLENVRKTQDEVTALLGKLPITPPDVPGCSGGKRKRGALSEVQLRALLRDRGILPDIGKAVKGALGDIGKLLSCAHDVVTTLTKTVEGIEGNTPDLGEIENLTDTLAEIGKDLEEEKEKEESSSTSEESSTTSEGSSSSSSTNSCTGSTAVPICTESVSLSTSFISGAQSISTVATITQTSCVTTTLSGCTGLGTTTTTTGSTSSASPSHISVSQDIYYYSSDSGAAITSLASKIEAEQQTLGCVTNWDQPNPTEGCDLSQLNMTSQSALISSSQSLSSTEGSSASATGPVSISGPSSFLRTSSVPLNTASVTSMNMNISTSASISKNPAPGWSASTTASNSGASFSDTHSTLDSTSSIGSHESTSSATSNSNADPTILISTSVSGPSQSNSGSTSLITHSTLVISTSISSPADTTLTSSVSGSNPTLSGSTSASGQGESTSKFSLSGASSTLSSSISSLGQKDSTSASPTSNTSPTLVNSASTTTSAQTDPQSSSLGVPSTLVTVQSSTASSSGTLLTLSPTSSLAATSAASSTQTVSTSTNSATLSASPGSASTSATSQSESKSQSAATSTLASSLTFLSTTTSAPPLSATPVPPPPPPPPPQLTPANCRGIDNTNWISRETMADGIRGFCQYAGTKNRHDDGSGSIASTYWPKISDATNFWIDWPQGVSLQQSECLRNMNSIMDNCDGGPGNPGNWKHGGNITYGQFTYHIEPTFDRGYQPGRCIIEFSADRKWHGYDVSAVTLSDNADIIRIKPPNDFLVMQGDEERPPEVKIASLAHGDFNMTLGRNYNLLFTYGMKNWTVVEENCGQMGTFDDDNGLHEICYFTC